MKETKNRRQRRLALALTQEDYDRLEVLAKVTGSLPAVVVRNVLVEYLDTHADEISEAQKAIAIYQSAIQNLPISKRNFLSDK